ncbi:uncharacterized protein LODBEIA_P25710 [Lodderomyces beijingensis]|uniref:Uncharacterized protein n=1 Tax=Lodderomyces beijingensis TaxID=1775926 RepID=A0ABP0ZLV2_9ASCO
MDGYKTGNVRKLPSCPAPSPFEDQVYQKQEQQQRLQGQHHQDQSHSQTSLHSPLSSLHTVESQAYDSADYSSQSPHKMTQAQLRRLEVESASTASHPFYSSEVDHQYNGQSDQSPLDNGNNENDKNNYSKARLRYTRTNSRSSNDSFHTSPAKMRNSLVSPSEDSYGQQGPHRFSHFVIDQQNPLVAQRLDELSDVTSSLRIEEPLQQQQPESNAHRDEIENNYQIGKRTKTSHETASSGSGGGARLREISDSMNSLATIFSTRPDPKLEQLILSSSKRRNTNTSLRKTATSLFGRNRNKYKHRGYNNNRTSTVRVYHDASASASLASSSSSSHVAAAQTKAKAKAAVAAARAKARLSGSSSLQSSTSLIRRQNAIRSKQGSWVYRLKLRIRKFLSKFKFFSFKASSKRNASIKRSHSGKKYTGMKSNTLVRKQRENPQNKDIKRFASISISNPLNNPQLGRGAAQRVSGMDDDLKKQAGVVMVSNPFTTPPQTTATATAAPSPPLQQELSIEEITDESQGKLNHLSNYINQQEGDYIKSLNTKRANGSHSASITDSPDLPSPQVHGSPITPRLSLPAGSTTTTPALLASISGISSNGQFPAQQPPPVPPHRDTTYMTQTQFIKQQLMNQMYSRYTMHQLWQSYLRQVVCRRITLRCEINQFHKFVARKETGNMINAIFEQVRLEHDISRQTSVQDPESAQPPPTTAATKEATAAMVDQQGEGERAASIKASSVYSYSAQTDTTASTIDECHDATPKPPQDEEFCAKVLHRRSMLGEMLEYHSSDDDEQDEDEDEDDDEVEYEGEYDSEIRAPSSLERMNSIVSSRCGSEIFVKKYATMSRRHSKNIRDYQDDVSDVASQSSVLRRSHGRLHNLSQLSSLAG